MSRRLFRGGLTFESAFDYYERVVYDADKLAAHIADLLAAYSCTTVLDCAAGTGTPGLQLRKLLGEGYVVDCSDGDAAMVAQFRRNARKMGVNDACEVRRWEDLHLVPSQYDYVMCRGNSLVYGQSWEGGSAVADKESIRKYLERIATVVKPGGYLHVDAPGARSFRFDGSTGGGSFLKRISVHEIVEDMDHRRLWSCDVEVRIAWLRRNTISFKRYSTDLILEELEPLVQDAGFEPLDPLKLDGDRPNGHAALLARKA